MLGTISIAIFISVVVLLSDYLSSGFTEKKSQTLTDHSISIGTTFLGLGMVIMFIANSLTNGQYWGLVIVPVLIPLVKSILYKTDSYIRFYNRTQQ